MRCGSCWTRSWRTCAASSAQASVRLSLELWSRSAGADPRFPSSESEKELVDDAPGCPPLATY